MVPSSGARGLGGRGRARRGLRVLALRSVERLEPRVARLAERRERAELRRPQALASARTFTLGAELCVAQPTLAARQIARLPVGLEGLVAGALGRGERPSRLVHADPPQALERLERPPLVPARHRGQQHSEKRASP
ncbi:MAG: hypothetical protein IPQ09_02495 [Myxococcales bacterium]|nr:hypothetical protein [Myxococcales bacterium]